MVAIRLNSVVLNNKRGLNIIDHKFTFVFREGNAYLVGEGSTLDEAKRAAEIVKETALMPNSFDFGLAVQLLKAGEKVAREGWNGKGMYLFLVNGDAVAKSISGCYGDPDQPEQNLPVRDAIYMKTADNQLVPWVASQTDVLAEDWVTV